MPERKEYIKKDANGRLRLFFVDPETQNEVGSVESDSLDKILAQLIQIGATLSNEDQAKVIQLENGQQCSVLLIPATVDAGKILAEFIAGMNMEDDPDIKITRVGPGYEFEAFEDGSDVSHQGGMAENFETLMAMLGIFGVDVEEESREDIRSLKNGEEYIITADPLREVIQGKSKLH